MVGYQVKTGEADFLPSGCSGRELAAVLGEHPVDGFDLRRHPVPFRSLNSLQRTDHHPPVAGQPPRATAVNVRWLHPETLRLAAHATLNRLQRLAPRRVLATLLQHYAHRPRLLRWVQRTSPPSAMLVACHDLSSQESERSPDPCASSQPHALPAIQVADRLGVLHSLIGEQLLLPSSGSQWRTLRVSDQPHGQAVRPPATCAPTMHRLHERLPYLGPLQVSESGSS